jgi:hypothetical protein
MYTICLVCLIKDIIVKNRLHMTARIVSMKYGSAFVAWSTRRRGNGPCFANITPMLGLHDAP